MAALALPPAPLDPVSGTPKLSLIPPAAPASPAAPEARAGRPRVRRLVVFTGKLA